MSPAKPTYHLPPNFSTPPPPAGPFHLGTVIKDFDRKEQMRPLNHGKDKDGKDKRISIPEGGVYQDHTGGFEATRSKLKSGELGIWAEFVGIEGIGSEASLSAKRSATDMYKFSSVDTEFFYPSPGYISQCMALADVREYMKLWKYKKPVYLITGLKVAKGASVRLEGDNEFKGKMGLSLNNPLGSAIQAGPRAERTVEDNHTLAFTESSDVVIGIQCLKIYYKTGWFGGEKHLEEEVYTHGAMFLSNEAREKQEVQFEEFVVVGPEDYNNSKLAARNQSTEEGKEAEIWMLPVESE
ncbi:hypothetical protein F5Y16DRAFT_363417 [Xylariaceae sp. FL0255]|nr:hypothetical protein F5Y16DRAFT_363417 [Xylariaceae sp. FL0255]